MAEAPARRLSDANPGVPIVFRSPLVAFDTTKPMPPRPSTVLSSEGGDGDTNASAVQESKGDDAPADGRPATRVSGAQEGWLFKDLGNVEELVEEVRSAVGADGDSQLFSGDDYPDEDPATGDEGVSNYTLHAGAMSATMQEEMAYQAELQHHQMLLQEQAMQQQYMAALQQQQQAAAAMQYQHMMMAGVGGYPVFTADQLAQMLPPDAASAFMAGVPQPVRQSALASIKP